MAYTRKSYRRRPKTVRRKRVYRRKAPLTRMIKAVTLKQCETKKSSQYTTATQNIFHNLAYYVGNLLATTQGTTDPQGTVAAQRNRIGDEVLARGISLKFFLQNEPDRPNVTYRIIIFRYNVLQDITPSTLNDPYFWAGTDGLGGNMNRLLDRPNTDRIKVIKEHWILPEKQANYSIQTAGPVPVGPKAKTMTRKFWIPMKNRKIKYRSDNSPYPMFTNVGFAVLAYDAINTAQTDNVCDLLWQSTFYYKDP